MHSHCARSTFLMTTLVCALVCCAGACAPREAEAQTVPRRAALEKAMGHRDIDAIRREIATLRGVLGDRAGLPETPDRFDKIPWSAEPLSPQEARLAVVPALARMKRLRWWSDAPDPRTLTHPLREVAETISGALAMRAVDPDAAEEALALARDAGEFLLRAQTEAGTGGFPFPGTRGGSDAAAFRASRKLLETAARRGAIDRVLRNGWIVDDLGDGGLQFDNAECGIAMLELHAATGESRYMAAARRAADWAIDQPLATNWNYNSFSIWLLSETWRFTGEARYREAALEKARYGLIPGQLRDGPYAGRWLDSHNARPAYHYIMLRALASLVSALPPRSAERTEIEAVLRAGLAARNRDFTTSGAPNRDQAWQALLAAADVYAQQPAVFAAIGGEDALGALRRLAAARWRAHEFSLAPRSFGLMLADAAGTRPPNRGGTAH